MGRNYEGTNSYNGIIKRMTGVKTCHPFILIKNNYSYKKEINSITRLERIVL